MDASDGSTDATVEAQRFADCDRLRVLAFPRNQGKVAALNPSVPSLRGEIVVFSDASATLAPDSVRRLVENFADAAVGAVSGIYKVIQADQVNIGASEDFYWRRRGPPRQGGPKPGTRTKRLKVQESQLASTLGGHGHLHAVRMALYPYPPPETINDDYVIPTSVVAAGYRAVHEPQAMVYEEAREMTGFRRRIRIMAGNTQQLRILAVDPPACARCRCSSFCRTKWRGWWLRSRCWRQWWW